MSEFKVGDTVERTEGSCYNMRRGDQGTVSHINIDTQHVQLKEFPGAGHSITRLKLVSSTSSSTGPQFKVGDRVKVIQDTCLHGVDKGTELTVRTIINERTIKVNESSQLFFFDDVKLITENTSSRPIGEGATLPIPLDQSVYCNCDTPIIENRSTCAGYSTMDQSNTYKFCTTCKKEQQESKVEISSEGGLSPRKGYTI